MALVGSRDHRAQLSWMLRRLSPQGHLLAWRLAGVSLLVAGAARAASADSTEPEPAVVDAQQPDDETRPAKRTRNTSLGRIFRGPFQSSRLYTMPSADVVGPYMLSLSGDGSLLQDVGILTSAGVAAVGFGDIAQLEYRHSSAISVTGINAPLPAVGVQFHVPIPEYPNVPAFGVAFRLGVPRNEQFGDVGVDERVHDLFLVGRLRFEAARWLTLHGGVRISASTIDVSGGQTFDSDPDTGNCATCRRTLYLPTGAYELQMNPTAKIVGEIALAPRFTFVPGAPAAPEIGYGLLGRLGMRWNLLPSVIIDGSIGYQLDVKTNAPDEGPGAIVTWDIRLGAEVFVPWGALACRAAGVFCD